MGLVPGGGGHQFLWGFARDFTDQQPLIKSQCRSGQCSVFLEPCHSFVNYDVNPPSEASPSGCHEAETESVINITLSRGTVFMMSEIISGVRWIPSAINSR